MEYTVHVTSAAERDIEYAVDYIDYVLKNPTAAERLFNQIKVKLPSLSLMPYRCALADDPVLALQKIRYIIIGNYYAFYQIDEPTRTVHILRFLYEKSDWKNILKSNDSRYNESFFSSKDVSILSAVK